MSGQREIRYSRLLSKFRRVLLLFEKACVQVFDVADIKLDDPANKTQAVYGILSEDKQQVEVFASDLPENTILEVVKGGYVSKDGKVRLMKTKKSWKIRK